MKAMLVTASCLALVLIAGAHGGSDTKGQAITVKGWGEASDPDGDCRFTVEKGRLRIGLPGTDHALAFERGQMNAPRALRAVEGDFIAQVEIAGPFPAGAASRVSSRRPFHGAGLLLWQDEKNYLRLERAELVFEGKNMSYANFEARTGGEFVRQGDASELPLAEGPTQLRLERRGGKVYGAVSADGIQWSSLKPIAVELPKRVLVGVAAGHNTSTPFEPEFQGFKVFAERGE